MRRALLAAAIVATTAGTAHAEVSNVIFLNRCVGGCVITKSGSNNALGDQSWFPDGDATTYNLSEFNHDDATWDALLTCVKDVYSAYDVVVTDVDPGSAAHTEVYVAGVDTEIGVHGAGGLGGPKSPISGDVCNAVNNNVAFVFANEYPASAVEYLCGVVAQESGHSFGMPDHVQDCRDPMSYSYYGPCQGGARGYFRNVPMGCVTTGGAPGLCQCGGRANDHSHLIGVFGSSGVSPPAPTVSIDTPADGAQIQATQSFTVVSSATRGVFKVELYLNGWLWATWNAPENLDPNITWPIPAELLDPPDDFPDGVIDVEVRAYDDIGTMASDTIQVTKGAPCTDASSCLDGQECASGKCFWEQPGGELGDACEFDQQCIGPAVYDGLCADGGDGTKVCSKVCYGGPGTDCGDGFTCEITNTADNSGVCMPEPPPPGCCSTGRDDGPPFAPLGLAGLCGLLVLRRRRR